MAAHMWHLSLLVLTFHAQLFAVEHVAGGGTVPGYNVDCLLILANAVTFFLAVLLLHIRLAVEVEGGLTTAAEKVISALQAAGLVAASITILRIMAASVVQVQL